MPSETTHKNKTLTEVEILDYWDNKVKRGFLSVIILKKFHELVNDEPIVLNGQKIKEYIKERTNSAWSPSPGSIYPILAVMEGHKIITKIPSENKRDKNFIITEFGEHLYQKLMKEALIFQNPENEIDITFQIPNYKDVLLDQYKNKSIRDVKIEYEKYKSITNILEEHLKDRIINDKEI